MNKEYNDGPSCGSEPTQWRVLDSVRCGLDVWKREVGRLLKGLHLRWEISRLEKRLAEEYTVLGRIAEAPRGRGKEKELCIRQIAFLKDEIERLRNSADQGLHP